VGANTGDAWVSMGVGAPFFFTAAATVAGLGGMDVEETRRNGDVALACCLNSADVCMHDRRALFAAEERTFDRSGRFSFHA